MDLSPLTLAQLRELNQVLPKEIERREKEERAAVRAEIEQLARQRGFEISDLLGVPDQKPKITVAIKYRHPQNSTLTWTGRGRKPKWVDEFLNNGGTMEQLLIA